MTYREALTIGKKIDGTIKCTFATLYDAKGQPLFSVQRRDAVRGMTYAGGYSDESTMQDVTITDLQSGVWVEGNRFGGEGLSMSVDLPIVQVAGEISNERLIAAQLIDAARDVIVAKLELAPKVWK